MTTTIEITPTYFECGAGKFKSTSRYLRSSTSGARFPIPQGKTLDFNFLSYSGWASGSIYRTRYSVNGYTLQPTAQYGGVSGALSVAAGSFTAAVTLVKF